MQAIQPKRKLLEAVFSENEPLEFPTLCNLEWKVTDRILAERDGAQVDQETDIFWEEGELIAAEVE